MNTFEDVDSALIGQKDQLLNQINDSRRLLDFDDVVAANIIIQECKIQLDFVRPMWEILSYGYKVDEVSDRIRILEDEILQQMVFLKQ